MTAQARPNHDYSLERARENFAKYLVMYEPENDRRMGGPDSPAVLAEKRTIVEAFEAMRTTTGHDALWERVREGERKLPRR